MKEKEEKEAEQKRKEVSAKLMRAKHLSLAESFKGKSPYDKKSERYLTIMKHLAVFIGNVPNSILENAEFKWEGDVFRGSDEECEEEEEEQGDDDKEDPLQVQLDDFESKELDHDVTYVAFLNRLACFAHILQLVVRKLSNNI